MQWGQNPRDASLYVLHQRVTFSIRRGGVWGGGEGGVERARIYKLT